MSKRIYITLNDKKDKDKVILEYLSSSYNESDTIKDILYRIATNNYNLNSIINKGKALNGAKSYENALDEQIIEDNIKVKEVPISSEIMEMF
ncbi:hypothetical protein PMY38_06355 [Clostridium tertium]|uniref:hypothetical protein n=1 Tax=Clostridium tertium TaxID=1559 RepID=UPI0018A01A86|nr:hypothetical protein [Clostridium tertium]MDB1947697.1 hypothetical protein [Clostridium tertium]MDB1956307.1 hypothetical protein [Clostridium tertium]MDB1958213.1 hypothetical protein [Clostridium tertium]MDB1961601.1 hypothetical protein [Clostridium tertium]MDB1967333.1 hypothetical protein [Clostridium tertium]